MDKNELEKILSMIVQDLRIKGHNSLIDVIKKAEYTLIVRDFFSVGPYHHTPAGKGYELVLALGVKDYNAITFSISQYETFVKQSIKSIGLEDTICSVIFSTKIERIIDWAALPPGVDKEYILKVLNWEKEVLIAVSTGTPIPSYEEVYKEHHAKIVATLKKIFVEHVNKFDSLWTWHKFYSKTFETYAERRAYVHELYAPLIKLIMDSEEMNDFFIEYSPTGWEEIDRAVVLMKRRLDEAECEIQHQDVGLHGRELLLTLAKIVYDESRHAHIDGNPIKSDQSGRMLEAYIHSFSKVLTSEEKAFAKAAVNLANNLTHNRNAGELGSELCYNAVLSAVQIIHSINKYEKEMSQKVN